MATAAKSVGASPIGVETAPSPAPGAREAFAAMVTDAGGEGESEDEGSADEATEVAADPAEAVVDASVLLPMLDQQRAAKLVGLPVETSSPEKATLIGTKAGGENPVPIMPPLAEAKTAPGAVTEGAPVMRPFDGDKAAPAAVTDSGPVMRPLDTAKPETAAVTDKTPVMPALDGGKPVTDPAPVMRAIDAKAGDPQTSPPVVQAQPPVKTAQPETKAATAEVQAAVAEAQAAPGAKLRSTRPTSAAAEMHVTAEEAPQATATETRAAVQPVSAPQTFAQPAAAPLTAPAQNVAAALSQQVLDMSGGDAWIDQIARDISQTAGKDGTMRFRLAPETLGELKVEITNSDRGAHVRMHVSSEAAQQALAAAEHKLTAEARAQGVRIAETEISFTNGQSQNRDAGAFAREQGQQANSQQQQRASRGAATNSFTPSAAVSEGRGRTDRYA